MLADYATLPPAPSGYGRCTVSAKVSNLRLYLIRSLDVLSGDAHRCHESFFAPHSTPLSSFQLAPSSSNAIYCNILSLLASKLVRWCSWLSRSPHICAARERSRVRASLESSNCFLLTRWPQQDVDRRVIIIFAQDLISKIAKNLSQQLQGVYLSNGTYISILHPTKHPMIEIIRDPYWKLIPNTHGFLLSKSNIICPNKPFAQLNHCRLHTPLSLA